jgi:hypothetical protein
VDTGRDLACAELWQQSLERSLARRGRSTRSSLELFQLRPERDLSRGDLLRESLMFSQLRRSAVERRPGLSLSGAGGISALALLAATTIPGLIGGRGGSVHSERVAFRPGERGGRVPAGSAHAAAAKDAVGLAISPRLTENSGAIDTPSMGGRENLGSGSSVTASAPAAAAKPPTAVHTRSVAAPAAHRSVPGALHAHIAADHDATGAGDRSAGVAHARSGGATAAPPRPSTAAPRVPGNPQPSGHPSTGGGAVEESSHSAVSTGHTSTPAAPAHPVATPHPAAPKPHPVTTTKPTHTIKPTTKPATTTHPVSTPHPVSKPHPVTTSHPAPAPAAPVAPVASGGYTNPLAGASLTPERIDQGVDYGGSGTLTALGAGRITYVGTSGTGWPGAFIEYQLSGGPDAGRYVYYAEGITPAPGLNVGQTVQAGQPLAQLIAGDSGGIEIGWGSGVGTQPLAQAEGQWGGSDDASNVATPAGKSFSALIASLGGPPGKVEG